MNKKLIILISSIIIAIIALISSTYALLFKTDITEEQSYKTGILEITSTSINNSVTLTNSLPTSDEEGAVSTPYTFKITNTGNLSYKFDIMLLSTTTTNQIDSQYIKVKVDNNEPLTLNTLTEGKIKTNITLKPNKSITINLRVWLSDNTPNTQIGKTFNGKITTDGQAIYTTTNHEPLDNSGANYPDLVDGLIPVVYNESTKTWVKADTESSTSTYGWYDYTQKKWANAVLVDDVRYSEPTVVSRTKSITGSSNITFGTAYYFDRNTNKFVLSNTDTMSFSSFTSGFNDFKSEYSNIYICSNFAETTCSTLYELKGVSENLISDYNEYSIPTIETSNLRSTYIDASPGTEIKEQDILAYYVWIPRYKYKVWNKDKVVGTQSYNAQTTGIDIVFESGTKSTGTISCTYSFASPSSTAGSPNETCTGSNGDYYTHPAFTFGDNQIKGFWMGKYELSSEVPLGYNGGEATTTLTPRILPNVRSWRGNYLSYFSTVIQNMQVSNNIYGLSTDKSTTDSHMLTNMEWGAVAYLTNSNYGRCSNGTCTEVTINNCSTYTTGIGADTVSAGQSSTTCTTEANKYNGEKGILASTTGNVYGVYDMNGGSWEYVMGNVSSTADTYTFDSSDAGFASSWYNDYSNQKYVNTYANGTTDTDQSAYNRGRLGDATGEVVLSTGGSGGWYNDYALFPYSGDSWFLRGGHYTNSSFAGIFYFDVTDGLADRCNSARAVLVWL